MSGLDPATRALVAVAAALDHADAAEMERLFREAVRAGAEPAWLDEIVLSAVLFVGFPRALVAAAALRTVVPAAGAAGDASDYGGWQAWRARGEETCRRIYGANEARLRENLAALHPALEAWVVVDGYGRTISRPALDLRRRELCAIAMLVPQGVPVQLHSHLRGALNVGASVDEVEAALATVATSGAAPDRIVAAMEQWASMRKEIA
jgi:4-carboxymuconolactone decarboxylase